MSSSSSNNGYDKNNGTTGLVDLLLLEEKVRGLATQQEIFYTLTNDTNLLVQYQTALVWWQPEINNELTTGKLVSVSGLPDPATDAPFTQWINQFCRSSFPDFKDPVTPIDSDSLDKSSSEKWREYFSRYGIWINLIAPDSQRLGALLLIREAPWTEAEERIFTRWASAATHSLQALMSKETYKPLWMKLPSKRKKLLAGCLVVIAIVFTIPVRQSVLAPVEVVADEPLIIRAPLTGVIAKVHVEANQSVKAGDLLVELDDTDLNAQLDVAIQELEISRAEYRSTEQESVGDRRASAKLPLLASRIKQKESELAYLESLLDRIRVKADRDGIAIILNTGELEGTPVDIGQKIMTLAEPRKIAFEFWLPFADLIQLPENSDLDVFLNIAPDAPLKGQIKYINYQAQKSPQDVLAFRGKSVPLKETDLPRIGLHGTAKIYGESVSLFYFVFRRPFAVVRQYFGL